jgi:hypothetical protein
VYARRGNREAWYDIRRDWWVKEQVVA